MQPALTGLMRNEERYSGSADVAELVLRGSRLRSVYPALLVRRIPASAEQIQLHRGPDYGIVGMPTANADQASHRPLRSKIQTMEGSAMNQIPAAVKLAESGVRANSSVHPRLFLFLIFVSVPDVCSGNGIVGRVTQRYLAVYHPKYL